MHSDIDTISDLNEIKKWTLDLINNAEVEDKMANYAPNIKLELIVDLESKNIPTEIMDAIRTRFYKDERNEN